MLLSLFNSLLLSIKAGRTTVDKVYGMPRDPRQEALGAAINTYTQLAGNNQGQPQGNGADKKSTVETVTPPAQNYSLQPNAQTYYTPGQAGQISPVDINNPYAAPTAAPTGTGYQGGPVNTQAAFNSGTYNPGYQPQQQAPAPQQSGPSFNYQPPINPGINQSAIPGAFNQGSYGSMNPPPRFNTGAGFNSNQYNPLNPNPYQPGQINYGPRG